MCSCARNWRFFFSHAINEAIAATDTVSVSQSIQPTKEQALVSRQLATLVDRQHYLNMRLDATTSNRILDMYLDSLDPDHSIFLAAEVAQYKQKYGPTFGAALKAGDLSGPFTIHAQYREHLKAFYEFVLNELKSRKISNSQMSISRQTAKKHHILKRLPSSKITGVKCWCRS